MGVAYEKYLVKSGRDLRKSGRGLGKVGVAYEKYLVKSGRGLRKSGRGLGKVGVAYEKWAGFMKSGRGLCKKYSEAQEVVRREH